MSQEPPAKKVRKGTKSCLECRQRKTRCIWPTDESDRCQSCLARNRTCGLQTQMLPTADAIASTSRARIDHLESEITSLWSVVRNIGTSVACAPTGSTSPSQTARVGGGNGKQMEGRCNDSDESDSTVSEISPANPPTHLLQLFDNDLLDTNEDGSAAASSHASSLHKESRNTPLRRLMPSRQDMITISASASSWMSLYNAIFPAINFIRTRDEMLSQFEKSQDPNADPVATAALLLSVAITVQQAPNDTTGSAAKTIKDASSFIKDVSDVVERVVVSDDGLAGSVEGIETAMLFLRLQLGRAKVRKTWLLLRRVIALAELIGLPRASMAHVSHREPPTEMANGAQSGLPPSFTEWGRRKAELWESICAIDRTTSMMWSLPLATINYPLPKRPILDTQGGVNPRSYQYNLVDIASRVLELDNIYSSGRPLMELLDAVIATDRELRSLASLAPQDWWRIHWPQLSIEALLQFWHQYLTVRAHLQLALKHDDGQQFSFNFITCFDACQELARRYIALRPILPAGFFANWVIDLQTFTATIFLLLASYRTSPGSIMLPQAIDVNVTMAVVDQALQTMEFAAGRVGGDCARQAADAVRSLRSLLKPSRSSESQKIDLNLPLVGRIHVSRKYQATTLVPPPSYTAPIQQPQPQGPWPAEMSTDGLTPTGQAISFGSSDLNTLDSLEYLMEIPEDYSFLTDETFGTEQWFTSVGTESNG